MQQYDGKLNIATGLNARSRTWKNQTLQWSELVDKLSEPTVTNETYAEFIKASKDEQGKIKDVGGYVGGYLRAGRRKPENVVHRQLLTLDLDFATPDIWLDYTLLFDNAAVLHGTHKNSEETPRFRLVMPLSREVTPDEYGAVSRKIAGILGIDLFDDTTFEINRLMFWPSISSDSEYFFESLEGPWLDVDQILGSYIDWTDSSLWPVSSRKLAKVHDATKKQQDPEEKRGLIGAFCRTYTIQDAISKFLADDYVEASAEGRYTYVKGSTAAGLTIYEDKFAYSHHGTDPSSGKLCNAFDLVRLHLFNHLDTTEESRKSFKAMEELVREDSETKKTIAKETIENAQYDFNEDLTEEPEPEEQNLDWTEDLEVDAKGKYLASAGNLNLIFANDPKLKKNFYQNDFDNKRYVFRSLPWRKIKEPETIKNVDYSGIRNYIESIYSIASPNKIEDAMSLEFQSNSFHPIRDYLRALKWDGKPRIDTLLTEYLGAKESVYTAEAMRKTLAAAVARVENPGVKFDLVLTLVGAQGEGKSTFFRNLGRKWFSDSFNTVSGRESFEQLQGAWIMEMAELAGLRKAEVESIKHFISKQSDSFRPAYGRVQETIQRQNIFVASTNNKDFLKDPTGNRRFLPVDIDTGKATKDVFNMPDGEIDQIWAEAYYLYKEGETLYLSSEATTLARVEQDRHSEQDERAGMIEAYLNTPVPRNWGNMNLHQRRAYLQDENKEMHVQGTVYRDYVCIAEIWSECLLRDRQDMDRYKTREVNDIMRGLKGWTQKKSTKNFDIYGKQKYYKREVEPSPDTWSDLM